MGKAVYMLFFFKAYIYIYYIYIASDCQSGILVKNWMFLCCFLALDPQNLQSFFWWFVEKGFQIYLF